MKNPTPLPGSWLAGLLVMAACQAAPPTDYPISTVSLPPRQVHDTFWSPRLQTNRTVSIPHNFEQCKRTGRIDAFLRAAQGREATKKGPSWWDSDVYKVIEGASYYLADHPDPALANYLDLLISVIAAAQEPDGYLHTFRTIDPRHAWNGPTRFSHPISHEFFNAGHLYEAAVAHHQATGRRNLLDIAIKNAELVCQRFGGREVGVGGPDKLIFRDHRQFDFGDSDFSVQLWFKPHKVARMGLFSGATDYWFGLDYHNQGQRNVCLWASSDGSRTGWDLIHGDAGGAGIGKIPLQLDAWNHIVAVRQGNNWKTYINNQVDIDITAPGVIVDKDEYKQLGMWADVGNWVNGAIDEFAIFDFSLTAEQVRNYYSNPVTPEVKDPKAGRPTGLWKMDEGVDGTVRDLSASNNHATTRGTEWVAAGALAYRGNRALDFVGDRTQYKPCHPEIELALAKLYQHTGQDKYLDLAKYLSDHRLADLRYPQDATRYEAQGHIVGSTYAWCGMTDLMALQKAPGYRPIIDSLWENVVSRKVYLTGGIGSRGEHFAAEHVLPNSGLDATPPPSVETCGAIAFALWSHRLFRLYGDAKYIDMLERTLYNAIPPNVSLAGDTFTYANPLAHDGQLNFNMGFPDRQAFLPSACCPTNVVRFLPQIPSMIYAQEEDVVYANLFVASDATLEISETQVDLRQTTDYPRSGHIEIQLAPKRPVEFTLRVRIPGWARNSPVPSDLYRYVDNAQPTASIQVNRERVPFTLEQGYAVITRSWRTGDTVVLDLPMPVRRVTCHEQVKSNLGKVALERGPIVYCAEGADNNGKVLDLMLPDDATLHTRFRPDLLNGVVVIEAECTPRRFTAIPYHSWLNRGQNAMTVWFARQAKQ